MNLSLQAAIEALLFVSGEPQTLARLAKTLGRSPRDIEQGVEYLKARYAESEESGLQILLKDNGVTLATKNEVAPAVATLVKSTMQENMSRAALEVLSIIAYRSPITRAEIEAIRGVNCSFTLRNLLLRDLIERAGNPEDGRGYIYRPTFKLLAHLGISTPADLPEYETLSQDERLQKIVSESLNESQNT